MFHRRSRNGIAARALLHALHSIVPTSVLNTLPRRRADARWTSDMLVLASVFMSWAEQRTVTLRFERTRELLTHFFPGRRRVGGTYTGFTSALIAMTPRIIEPMCEHLRATLRDIAGSERDTYQGWTAFAVDGTKIECPRTKANEIEFGVAGKRAAPPQMFLTALWHMGTGLPWSWRIDGVRSSERDHLLSMLPSLPANALIVGDGGFIGYEFLRQVVESGRHFLVRPGANVRLFCVGAPSRANRQSIAFLWPNRYRDEKPLVVRLIRVRRGKRSAILMTNVLSSRQLSRSQAMALYTRRWGVEVYFRSVKQTLGRKSMRSHAPAQARVELEWSMVGAMILGLSSAKALVARGRDPIRSSFSGALNLLRPIMCGLRTRGAGVKTLLHRLAEATIDDYVRKSPKERRKWPHKRSLTPSGSPKLITATRTQIQTMKDLLNDQWPILLTA